MIYTHRYKIAALSLLSLLSACGGGGGGSSTPAPNSSSGPATGSGPVLGALIQINDGTAVGAPNATWPVSGDTSTGGNGAPVGGNLACGAPGASYAYTHLNIYVDGVQQAIPTNIGWVSPDKAVPAGSVAYTCTYPLHTDDNSGKIRVDTSTNTPYTLGQFFQVWGQPLSATNVAGLTGKPITVYVNDNGTLSKYTGDLSQLALTPNRDISIVVGAPPAQIANYGWIDPAPLDPTPINIVAGGSIGTPQYAQGDTANGGQGQTVDGLACAPMGTAYHVHAHVTIIKNQVPQQQPTNIISFPANVGIVGTSPSQCFYPIHVHDGTGSIHVEAASYQPMTLGQLFDIWGMPLSATEAADSNGAPVAYFINDGGDLRQYMGDPKQIELLSHRSITIQIGAPAKTIPSFNWATYDEPR